MRRLAKTSSTEIDVDFHPLPEKIKNRCKNVYMKNEFEFGRLALWLTNYLLISKFETI